MSQPYIYIPLSASNIRIFELQPGSREDPIRINILYEDLPPHQQKDKDSGFELSNIQQTLPEGCRVFRTPEGKFFYATYGSDEEDMAVLSYRHPVSGDHGCGEEVDVDASEDENVMGPQFEALSYVWGSMDETKGIAVTDGDVDAPERLQIGKNLHTALKELRSLNDTRRLWVDAICINQSDVHERARQVTRMGSIYGQASRVVVWLGLPDEETAEVFKTLEYVGRQVEIADEAWYFPAMDAEDKRWGDNQSDMNLSMPQQKAVARVLSRPWFQRVWTLQEILLAKPNAIVQCGGHKIQFYFLRRAIAALGGRQRFHPELLTAIENFSLLTFGDMFATAPGVLEIMRGRECKDFRDKIYGALGLMGADIASYIHPSYTFPVTSLYRIVFLIHCRLTRRLDLLVYCVVETLTGEPSWIPDWRSEGKTHLKMMPGFQAAGFSEAVFRENKPGILLVEGVECGQIVYSSPPCESSSLASRLEETRPPINSNIRYPTGETAMAGWARAVAFDMTSERFPDFGYPTLRSRQDNLLSFLESAATASLAEGDVIAPVDAASYSTFIRMDSGYNGFAAGNVMRGDKVVVFLGCWTPMVLRTKAAGQYAVVGPCFLPGLMDSEALLDKLPYPWAVEQWNTPKGLMPRYRNTLTEELRVDDPRLEPLPEEWERVEVPWTKTSPAFADWFRNKHTNEVQSHDPRMTADKLRARGVALREFELI